MNIARRLIKYIKRPKITIYLKSGNVVRTRLYPSTSYDWGSTQDILTKQYGDIITHDNREALSYRAWWQSWPN